jgi:hypothetical protein
VFSVALGFLVVWAIVAIVGALVPGLLWLTITGSALFLLTGAVAGAHVGRVSR